MVEGSDEVSSHRIEQILHRWETTGTVSDEEYRALRDAAESAEIAARVAPLLPYIERDRAGAEASRPHLAADFSVRDDAFTTQVMKRVAAEPPPRTRASARNGRVQERTLTARFARQVVSVRGAAAAAVAIVVLATAMVVWDRGAATETPEGAAPVVMDESENTVIVRFELVEPRAERVAVVGDFNEWNPERHQAARPDDDGVWRFELELRRGRAYSYNFLIDGEVWIPDPSGLERIEDDFGTEKSLIHL